MTVDLTKPAAALLAIALVGFVVGGFLLPVDGDYAVCLDEVAGRRARMAQRYLCSPRLLTGDWQGYYRFVWLWALPVLVAAVFLHRLIRKSAS